MLVEDVDFTRATPLRAVARKSLAVNLSDVAAMGAVPQYALVALALPEWALPKADELLVAFAEAAREWKVEIVGGDFSRAAKLTVSVTAVGRIEMRALLRSGAKRGDRIFVSRPLGAAMAGLRVATAGVPPGQRGYAEREFAEAVLRRQTDPEPEIALGPALARIAEVTACIDVSDGLSTDLHHLCEASGLGAEIDKERLPLFPDLLTFGPALGVNVRDAVLHGGEEYALLFTASLTESEASRRLGRPVYAIGRMTAEAGVLIREEGVSRPLEARGWDHFA
jgi:thiamine-monophosphate kinase